MKRVLTVAACALATVPAVAQTTSVAAMPDAASVVRPTLAFATTPAIEADFDKYFYFNRPDTDFATALGDVRECDALARGLVNPIGNQPVYYPYAGTMAGAVGGALGNVLASAIFGSAEKRRLRRVNMRRCMNYKGYGRYGLEKELWQRFHFEEGFSGTDDTERQTKLAQQALVASGPVPQGKALGL